MSSFLRDAAALVSVISLVASVAVWSEALRTLL